MNSYYSNMDIHFAGFDEYKTWFTNNIQYEFVEDDIEYELVEDDDIEYEVVEDDDITPKQLDNTSTCKTLDFNIKELEHIVNRKLCDYYIFKDKYRYYKNNLMYKYFIKLKKWYIQKQKEEDQRMKHVLDFFKVSDEEIALGEYLESIHAL